MSDIEVPGFTAIRILPLTDLKDRGCLFQLLNAAPYKKVNYALGELYYICNESNKVEVLKPEVIDVIKRYAAAEEVSVSFSNLAKAFLDKHLSGN
ncbi:armadillo repeat-containing protein [Trifolium pratense]|uniref:Armadillo repeat-containing protein n=1 Tax=Trifolium pratense TaxID=57577 RepID=A0A2K3MEK8_TRIPR|nr:armadillo repeat-containing protein [Trifolium pratense]